MVTIDLVVCISCDQKCHFRNAASNTTLYKAILLPKVEVILVQITVTKNAEKIDHSYANI